jgi:hypothetical protein
MPSVSHSSATAAFQLRDTILVIQENQLAADDYQVLRIPESLMQQLYNERRS